MLRLQMKKIILCVCLFILVYILVCCLVPPLFQRAVREDSAAPDLQDIFSDAPVKERILCIDDNMEALLWRLKMINMAEKEIVLTTFDFRDDNSGRDVIAALMDAADRGVNIQILVDGINGMLYLRGNVDFQALVSRPEVEAKLYNPINPLKLWTVNYRIHDKYLIVDDFAYILGGRNTNDLFLGNFLDRYNVDRDVLVYIEEQDTDTSLAELKNYFESEWELACNRALTYKPSGKRTAAAHALASRFADMEEIYPFAFQEIDIAAETMEVDHIAFLTNPIGAENKEPTLWHDLCMLMKDGSDILIQTPYIVCNNVIYSDLTELCSGTGREIRIMTNALENGANPFGCVDYLNSKSKIRSTGVEVFEWLGGQSLHSKMILIDDHISIIGSYNLDIRSTYLDTEMMLVIDSPALNASLRTQYAEMEEQSKHVFPDGSEECGEEYIPVQSGFWKRCRNAVLRLLIYPFRHVL